MYTNCYSKACWPWSERQPNWRIRKREWNESHVRLCYVRRTWCYSSKQIIILNTLSINYYFNLFRIWYLYVIWRDKLTITRFNVGKACTIVNEWTEVIPRLHRKSASSNTSSKGGKLLMTLALPVPMGSAIFYTTKVSVLFLTRNFALSHNISRISLASSLRASENISKLTRLPPDD